MLIYWCKLLPCHRQKIEDWNKNVRRKWWQGKGQIAPQSWYRYSDVKLLQPTVFPTHYTDNVIEDANSSYCVRSTSPTLSTTSPRLHRVPLPVRRLQPPPKWRSLARWYSEIDQRQTAAGRRLQRWLQVRYECVSAWCSLRRSAVRNQKSSNSVTSSLVRHCIKLISR